MAATLVATTDGLIAFAAMGVLTTEEAIALLAEDPSAVHLDVRSVPEFEAGHAPGAYNIPISHRGPMGMTPNQNFISEVERAFKKDAVIVVSCAAGSRSGRAVQALLEAGFSEVHDHCAGWRGGAGGPGWVDGGGEHTLASQPGRAYEDLK